MECIAAASDGRDAVWQSIKLQPQDFYMRLAAHGQPAAYSHSISDEAAAAFTEPRGLTGNGLGLVTL